jgi:hypothetical protein
MKRLRQRRDTEFYRAWGLAHTHCQACGIPAASARVWRWPGLSRHHIVKFKRSHEECNLLMLCQRCHDLAEGLTVKQDGILLPTLPLAVCLSIKAIREPLQFNPARLQELYGRALPSRLPIPGVFEMEYRQWRSQARHLWQRECGGNQHASA